MKNEETSLFRHRLKIAMELNNLTQAQLSRKVGLNKGYISSYLGGKYEPKQDKIFLLSQALNVTPSWLMGYDELYKNELFKSDYDKLSKENKEKVNELIQFYLNNQRKE